MDHLQPAENKPAFPRVLALANQKGGVGKTTTTINLAAAFALDGIKVLVIDLDPQGNASTGLGLDRASRSIGTYDLLVGSASLAEAAQKTQIPNLSIVPATQDLSGAEIELVEIERREFRLADALKDLRSEPPKVNFDYVLIDCPPALGLLTINAFGAADAVLVPLQCEFFALEGLAQLTKTVERARQRFNQKLQIAGVVLTMYDRRNNLSELVAADVRSVFHQRVYDTLIPRNVRVSEAPSHGKPVLLYDASSAGAVAYRDLAREMLRRDGWMSPEAAAKAAADKQSTVVSSAPAAEPFSIAPLDWTSPAEPKDPS